MSLEDRRLRQPCTVMFLPPRGTSCSFQRWRAGLSGVGPNGREGKVSSPPSSEARPSPPYTGPSGEVEALTMIAESGNGCSIDLASLEDGRTWRASARGSVEMRGREGGVRDGLTLTQGPPSEPLLLTLRNSHLGRQRRYRSGHCYAWSMSVGRRPSARGWGRRGDEGGGGSTHAGPIHRQGHSRHMPRSRGRKQARTRRKSG